MTKQTIYNVVNTSNIPSSTTIISLSNFFNVPISDLYYKDLRSYNTVYKRNLTTYNSSNINNTGELVLNEDTDTAKLNLINNITNSLQNLPLSELEKLEKIIAYANNAPKTTVYKHK